MAELQEAGLVGATPLSLIPSIRFLGIHSTFQSLLPQAFLMALALFALIYFIYSRRNLQANI